MTDGRGAAHIAYFDWIRAVACVAVVLIHLCATYTSAVPIEEMGFANAVRVMFVPTVLARWAVPLFFMMTGALLLDPARPLDGRKLLGYAGRMLTVMGTFGLAFSLMKCVADAGGFDARVLGTAVLGLLDGSTWGHLWYVAALMGLYVVTPLFRAFVRGANVRQVEAMLLVLYVLGCVIPLVNAVFDLSITTLLPVSYTLFYFLLGHYAHALIERGSLARGRGKARGRRQARAGDPTPASGRDGEPRRSEAALQLEAAVETQADGGESAPASGGSGKARPSEAALQLEVAAATQADGGESAPASAGRPGVSDAKDGHDVMVPVTVMGGAALLGMLAAIVVCIRWFDFDGYIFTDPLSFLVGPYALLVFMLFKRHANRPVARRSAVGVLSAHCFGIYIVHPVFTRLIKMVDLQGAFMALPPLVGEALFTAAIVLLALACVWLLDRTRFCREYLRL